MDTIDAGHYEAVRKDKESRNKDSKSTTSKKDKVPNVMFAQLNFANVEGRCYCCGKAGHISPNCRNKDKIPREKWAINKWEAMRATGCIGDDEGNYCRLNHFDYVPPRDED